MAVPYHDKDNAECDRPVQTGGGGALRRPELCTCACIYASNMLLLGRKMVGVLKNMTSSNSCVDLNKDANKSDLEL